MFNTTTNSQRTEIKSPATGIIQRSNEKSFFLKLHQNSKLADNLFEPGATYQDQEISILQMMLINEGYIIAECIYLKDIKTEE